MPTLDRIAKTIVGPNESHNTGLAKLTELQDLKWGRVKAQEQAHFLRSARYVKALFDDEQGSTQGAAQSTEQGPRAITTGTPAPPPQPAAAPCDTRSTQHLLFLFRGFVIRNVMTWLNGAGDHHHPIWLDVAEELDQWDLNHEITSGPDYQYIQPLNRKPHAVLLEEFVAKGGEVDANSQQV